MSKNFELLQRAGRAEDLMSVPLATVRPRNGNGHLHKAGAVEEEEIVKLVQRVFTTAGSEGPRVVVFSGIGNSHGSSHVCAQTAQALAAHAAGTVCVVDANLRAPSLHAYFDVQNLTGLADGILASGQVRNLAVRIAAGNLWVIPAGPPSHNGTVLRALDRFKMRLHELRNEFDHVLINSPELDRFSDANVIGRQADGLILVIEANSTPRLAIEKTKASLSAAEVRLLGAVLNNRTFPIPQALYNRLR